LRDATIEECEESDASEERGEHGHIIAVYDGKNRRCYVD
jgi:hypothetical protein